MTNEDICRIELMFQSEFVSFSYEILTKMLSLFVICLIGCSSLGVYAQQTNTGTRTRQVQPLPSRNPEPTCYFPKELRGKWMLMNWQHHDKSADTGLYVVIRDNHLELDDQFVNAVDNKTYVRTRMLFCKQYQVFRLQRTWQLLLESALYDEAGHLLCIRLRQVIGTGYPMMSIERTNNADPNQSYFQPLFSPTAANVTNTCTVTSNNPLFLRETRPGCQFPQSLHKTWSYGGPELRTIQFSSRLAYIRPEGYQQIFSFQCERLDELKFMGDNYFLLALRTKNLRKTDGSIVDGLLCLKVVLPNPNSGEVSRFNSGTLLKNAVKEIKPSEIVHMLRDSCDLVNQEVVPVKLTANKM